MNAVVLAHRPRSRRASTTRRRAHSATWSTEGSSALASFPGEPRQATTDFAPAEVRPLHPRRLDGGASAARDSVTRPLAVHAPQSLRLTRRGRLAITLSVTAAVVLLSLTLVPVVAAGVASAFAPTAVSTTTVVVEPGQSLWEVAEAAAPGRDTASVVAAIADANGITSAAEVRPGQRLVVPLS
jgi:nucleoid-associated protein YgaU